jgi:hypothetical protein
VFYHEGPGMSRLSLKREEMSWNSGAGKISPALNAPEPFVQAQVRHLCRAILISGKTET